jgi:hypothetical protein
MDAGQVEAQMAEQVWGPEFKLPYQKKKRRREKAMTEHQVDNFNLSSDLWMYKALSYNRLWPL